MKEASLEGDTGSRRTPRRWRRPAISLASLFLTSRFVADTQQISLQGRSLEISAQVVTFGHETHTDIRRVPAVSGPGECVSSLDQRRGGDARVAHFRQKFLALTGLGSGRRTPSFRLARELGTPRAVRTCFEAALHFETRVRLTCRRSPKSGCNPGRSRSLGYRCGVRIRGTAMPKSAHTEAADHHEKAAKSHRAAAEHHDKGDHATAGRHAAEAHGHSAMAHDASAGAHKKSSSTK